MAAITNSYFKHGTSVEQNLFEGLKIEAIQVMGRKVYYLPRQVQTEDLVLGEDVLSKFSLAIPIEMYMENFQGFEGDREMFSKFGIQMNNSYKLVVSQKRWEKEIKTLFDNDPSNGEALFDVINNRRPQEGDLIYDPLIKFLFEIKFTDHDQEFYQLGKNYLYTLSCEAFQYQSESIETGIAEIDSFENESLDLLKNQLMSEMDEAFLIEPWCDSYLIMDTVDTVETHYMEHGTDFTPVAEAIKYTIENPFE